MKCTRDGNTMTLTHYLFNGKYREYKCEWCGRFVLRKAPRYRKRAAS